MIARYRQAADHHAPRTFEVVCVKGSRVVGTICRITKAEDERDTDNLETREAKRRSQAEHDRLMWSTTLYATGEKQVTVIEGRRMWY